MVTKYFTRAEAISRVEDELFIEDADYTDLTLERSGPGLHEMTNKALATDLEKVLSEEEDQEVEVQITDEDPDKGIVVELRVSMDNVRKQIYHEVYDIAVILGLVGSGCNPYMVGKEFYETLPEVKQEKIFQNILQGIQYGSRVEIFPGNIPMTTNQMTFS